MKKSREFGFIFDEKATIYPGGLDYYDDGPMRVRLNEPTFGEEEIAAAVDVMRSTYVTQGAKVAEFEAAFCEKFGFAHAVACNSGSSANLLMIASLVALEYLEHGDEVFTPALTWPTTVWPLVQYGLVPAFVDCNPDTLNMQSPGGGIVFPVHVYGNPYTRRDAMIEDCCEAMGAPVGKTGMAASFSFYFSHHITTFEGGMLATDNPDIASRARAIRSHGWTRDCPELTPAGMDPKFTFIEAGYNLRLTDVAAAVGLVQLPKLDAIVETRRENHKSYLDALSKFEHLRFQVMDPNSACFSFAIIATHAAPFNVGDLRRHLESAGIETRPIIAGNIVRQPAMAQYKHICTSDLDNASYVMDHGFAIGNHQDITLDHIDYVANAIEDFLCTP